MGIPHAAAVPAGRIAIKGTIGHGRRNGVIIHSTAEVLKSVAARDGEAVQGRVVGANDDMGSRLTAPCLRAIDSRNVGVPIPLSPDGLVSGETTIQVHTFPHEHRAGNVCPFLIIDSFGDPNLPAILRCGDNTGLNGGERRFPRRTVLVAGDVTDVEVPGVCDGCGTQRDSYCNQQSVSTH